MWHEGVGRGLRIFVGAALSYTWETRGSDSQPVLAGAVRIARRLCWLGLPGPWNPEVGREWKEPL